MDPISASQLSVIHEIEVFLSADAVSFWLRGGWALDFHAGRITREHGDIDLVSWDATREAVRQLFNANGFEQTRDTEADFWFERDGVEVAVAFIVRRDGPLYVAGHEEGIPLYMDDAVLGQNKQTLHEASCRVISLEGLIREKEQAPNWLGRAQRPKDIADLVLLHQLRKE